jgi:phage-related minor tail protein
VYDSPQVFAFAKGAGVFAEAGPEAIMPLQRDSRGRLGVTAAGGAGPQSIRVSIHNEGKPQEVVSAQPRFDLEGMVIDVVTRDLATEGTIAKGMQARYGLSRAAGAYA